MSMQTHIKSTICFFFLKGYIINSKQNVLVVPSSFASVMKVGVLFCNLQKRKSPLIVKL